MMKNWREDYTGVIPNEPYKKMMMTMRRRQNKLITNNIQDMKTPKSTSLSGQGGYHADTRGRRQ